MAKENIQLKNAKEEIFEIVDKCNSCGLCKAGDSVFKVLREEAVSSRGRCTLFSEEVFDKSIFDDPLDGNCNNLCPLGIDMDKALRKARKILNLKGKELKYNKEVLKKIKQRKNPFSE